MNLTQQQQAQQWLAAQQAQKQLQTQQQGFSGFSAGQPTVAVQQGAIPTIQYPSSTSTYGSTGVSPGFGQFLDQWTPFIAIIVFLFVAVQMNNVMKGKNGKDWGDLIIPAVVIFGLIFVYTNYLRPMF